MGDMFVNEHAENYFIQRSGPTMLMQAWMSRWLLCVLNIIDKYKHIILYTNSCHD